MCGIGGFAAADDALEVEETLKEMLGLLAHRGPDDSGIAVDRSRGLQVGLCATRLAIRDLSEHGHQPMTSNATGCVVAFNGELYNADELRQTLAAAGRSFAGSSDTEVALAAFDRWGHDCVRRLRGMFALAWWDPRDASLTLARDPLGIKPLYVAEGPSGLWFASELRVLLRTSPLCGSIDLRALESFLATGSVAEPRTMVEGVRMLPAGSVLRHVAGRSEILTYWRVEDAFDQPPRVSDSEAASAVRAELEASVRRQLVSDAPLGVFLSGGIDSSALVGLAATVGDRPSTVSIDFLEAEYSESRFIDAVQRRWSTDHHVRKLTAQDFLRQLPDALSAMDQPTVDGVNTYVVSALARRVGLTVALSGVGGDELFAGYESFRSVPRLEQFRDRLPALPGPLATGLGRALGRGGDRGRKLGRWLGGEDIEAYALQRELLEPDLRRRLLPDAPVQALPVGHARDADGVSSLELTRYMRNQLLRDADVMSMAHGLEVRVPLLDQDLVELVASLPASVKTAGDGEKPLLVAATRDLLPDAILHREKAGFTLPFDRWLRGPIKAEVRDRLLDAGYGGAVAEALSPEGVTETWQAFEGGRTSWSRPWALYVAKTWGQRHLS